MPEKMSYSRYKFSVKKKVLNCFGQRQTRRGTYYPAEMVQVPLADRSAKTLKAAMAEGVAQLNEIYQLSIPL